MKNMKKKSVLMLAMMVLLLTFAVGGTIAYIVTSTDPVVNTFEPAQLDTEVDEPDWNDGDTVKKNVTIKVTGNIEAKVRAAIVVTWQDAAGNIAAAVPVQDTDYSIEIGSDWTRGNDGFYYYNSTVQAPGSTTNLIKTCTVLRQNGDYHLVVEVLGSAIQADQN